MVCALPGPPDTAVSVFTALRLDVGFQAVRKVSANPVPGSSVDNPPRELFEAWRTETVSPGIGNSFRAQKPRGPDGSR